MSSRRKRARRRKRRGGRVRGRRNSPPSRTRNRVASRAERGRGQAERALPPRGRHAEGLQQQGSRAREDRHVEGDADCLFDTHTRSTLNSVTWCGHVTGNPAPHHTHPRFQYGGPHTFFFLYKYHGLSVFTLCK